MEIYQARTKIRAASPRIQSPQTFAHILHNVGFGSLSELNSMVTAWGNLYRHLDPDIIIFDHSPTAGLLAAGAILARQANPLGPGFFVPPSGYPMQRIQANGDGSHASTIRSRIKCCVTSTSYESPWACQPGRDWPTYTSTWTKIC